jgi:hypothetical protein
MPKLGRLPFLNRIPAILHIDVSSYFKTRFPHLNRPFPSNGAALKAQVKSAGLNSTCYANYVPVRKIFRSNGNFRKEKISEEA